MTDDAGTSGKARARSWVSGQVGVERLVSRAADVAYGGAKRLGVARYPLRVQQYALRPPGWTPGLRLSVAVIADTHFGGVYVDDTRLDQILARTTALEPDLILLLGDYGASGLDGAEHRVAMSRLSATLAGLTSPLGTYAIIGDHDWWDDQEAQRTGRGPVIAARELATVGITVLENQAIQLTHGGQIRVLGRTPVVPSIYRSRYVDGHVVEDARHLIVSGGLGTSPLPVRIGSRPEIVHLQLG